MRPRIGLNCDFRETPRAEAFVRAEYVRAVEAVGGVPILLPPLERVGEAARLVAQLDGLVLTGGDDIDPARYGEAPHPSNEPLARVREGWDFALARAVERRRLPTLAICCGFQLLNVHRGGTLIQDIASQVGAQVTHRIKGGPYPFHRARIAPGSRLHAICGTGELEVNSAHHQALGRLGRGLVATAWAEDGVIEAVEGKGARFLVAVQWHPERLGDRAPHRALFAALMDAAARTGRTGRES